MPFHVKVIRTDDSAGECRESEKEGRLGGTGP
jgi:hypothetical protein